MAVGVASERGAEYSPIGLESIQRERYETEIALHFMDNTSRELTGAGAG